MNKIKELRTQKGMTQRALSIELDITDDYLSVLERGGRTPGHRLGKKIADYFGLTIDEMNYFSD